MAKRPPKDEGLYDKGLFDDAYETMHGDPDGSPPASEKRIKAAAFAEATATIYTVRLFQLSSGGSPVESASYRKELRDEAALLVYVDRVTKMKGFCKKGTTLVIEKDGVVWEHWTCDGRVWDVTEEKGT